MGCGASTFHLNLGCICVTAACALSTLNTYITPEQPAKPADEADAKTDAEKSKQPEVETSIFSTKHLLRVKAGVYGVDSRLVVLATAVFKLTTFIFHCTWVTSRAYSSPSVVLASRNPDGSLHIIDDF